MVKCPECGNDYCGEIEVQSKEMVRQYWGMFPRMIKVGWDHCPYCSGELDMRVGGETE